MAEADEPGVRLPLTRSSERPSGPIGTPVTSLVGGGGVVRVASDGSLRSYLSDQLDPPPLANVSAPSSPGSSRAAASVPTPPRREAPSECGSAATAPVGGAARRRTPPRRAAAGGAAASSRPPRAPGASPPKRGRERGGLVDAVGTGAYYATKYGLWEPLRYVAPLALNFLPEHVAAEIAADFGNLLKAFCTIFLDSAEGAAFLEAVERLGSAYLGAAATPEGRRLCADGTTTLLATFETLASPQAAATMDAVEQAALDALELLSTPEARASVTATRSASRALVELLNSAHTKAALAEHVDNVIENLRAHRARRGEGPVDDPGVASLRALRDFRPPAKRNDSTLSECSSEDDDEGGEADDDDGDGAAATLASPVDALRGLLAQAREDARRARDAAADAAPVATLPRRSISGPTLLCLLAAAATVGFLALVGGLVLCKGAFDIVYPKLAATYAIIVHDEL